LRERSNRRRKLDDDGTGTPRQQLRGFVRLERLVQDHAYLLLANRGGELRKPRRTRGHAIFGLDHVNNIETATAGEIRPGIVVRHKARGLISREIALPDGQSSLQVGEKTVAPSKCIRCIVRGYPRNCLSHRSGDELGIFWIEPVVRVGETMGVTVASARIEGAALHLKKRYAARGID